MKLLLIAPSTRAMAESAIRAGYDVVSLDYFGDYDQRKICTNYSLSHDFHEDYSLENLLRHRQILDYTHVIYGSGFENYPELVEVLEGEGILLGNPPKTLRKVRDWEGFFRTLGKMGIPHPETQVVSKDEAREMLREDKKLIIKPLKSGGGHSIYDSSNIDEGSGELEEKVLIQEFVKGRPASATVIASRDTCYFLGATEQLIGDSMNKYRYTGNIAPLSADAEIVEKITEVSRRITRVFGLIGSNSVDFILGGDETVVTEVNPRVTGALEVLEKAFKVNLLELHIKACKGEFINYRVEPQSGFYGKKILFAEDEVSLRIGRLAFVKDIPWHGEKIEKGSPICTVLGSGKTREECIQDLAQKEAVIQRGFIHDQNSR
jgi:hypothetical protein